MVKLRLNLSMGKLTIWVFDLVRHKPGCTALENSFKLEVSDLDRKDIGLPMQRWTTYAAKTKAQISCAVTAQLICTFAFAYADY